MQKKHQRTVVLAAIAAVVAVAAVGGPQAKRFVEEVRLLRQLDSVDLREKAAEELSKRACLRAIPKLLRLSDPQWVKLDINLSEYASRALDEIAERDQMGSFRAVLDCLREGDPVVRSQAAWRLHEEGPWLEQARPSLIRALSDDDDEVRSRAALCLWRLGAEAGLLVPVVSDVIRRADRFVDTSVAAEVLYLLAGEDASSATVLAAHARSKLLDGRFARRAWAGLIAMGDVGARALESLLSDNSAEVRREAATALAKMGPAAAFTSTSLVRATGDPEESVRKPAIYALAAMASEAPNATPRLVEILLRGEPHTDCSIAAEALGECGPSATGALPALISALELSTPPVAMEAVKAIGKICPEPARVLPVLVQALDHSDDGIRAAAAESLARLGPDAKSALPYLEGHFRDASLRVRVWAAAAVVAMGEDHRGQLFLELIQSLKVWQEDVRIVACEIHELLGPTAAQAAPELVRRALDDSEIMQYSKKMELVSAYQIPVRALLSVGPTAGDLTPVLEALRGTNKELRTRAFRILSELGPAAAAASTAIIDLLDAASPEVRAYAAEIVPGLGAEAPGAIPTLTRLLSARDPGVRLQSWNALRKILGTRDVFRTLSSPR